MSGKAGEIVQTILEWKAFQPAFEHTGLLIVAHASQTRQEKNGEVSERLKSSEADSAVLKVWHEIVHQEILTEDEDDKFL